MRKGFFAKMSRLSGPVFQRVAAFIEEPTLQEPTPLQEPLQEPLREPVQEPQGSAQRREGGCAPREGTREKEKGQGEGGGEEAQGRRKREGERAERGRKEAASRGEGLGEGIGKSHPDGCAVPCPLAAARDAAEGRFVRQNGQARASLRCGSSHSQPGSTSEGVWKHCKSVIYCRYMRGRCGSGGCSCRAVHR